MPIRNEAAHLRQAIASIRSQAYQGPLRIILGIGPSDDGTVAVAEQLADDLDELTVVANPSGQTPSGLNAAIQAGDAPVIVRVDGHSELSAGYIRRAVELLRTSGAVNVGGVQRPQPTTPFETSVADATTSLLGTGGASYRVGTEQREVDTVYLGVFDRRAIEAVGLFDETLTRNQDYELNIRLRKAGGTILFDPTLSVGYVPRSTWGALARQYYEYGWWKSVVMRKHPDSARVRQVVPPVAMTTVITSSLVATRWRPAALVPLGYLGALAAASRGSSRPLTTMGATATIHACWAAGFLRGGIANVRRRRDATPPDVA